MTPQEIFEYKNRWKPGHTVQLHSDIVDRGKSWCKRHLEQHQWSVSIWTDVYEHTFHFENEQAAGTFTQEFKQWATKCKI